MYTMDPNQNQAAVIPELETALESARRKGDPRALLPALAKLGQAYLQIGEAPKALTQFDEGFTISRELQDEEAGARFLGFRGLALKQIGNFDLALRVFRQSNRLATKIGHDLLVCDSHIQAAMLLTEKGMSTKAISQLSQAMHYAVEKNDLPRKMRIASLLGDNFARLESFDKAVEYYVIAYECSRDLDNIIAASSFLTQIGNIFLQEGELESATGQYERALNIASQLEDANAEIHILGGLFRAHARAGDLRLATTYADRVIHLARQSGHRQAELANLDALTTLFIQHGDYRPCLPHLERALQLLEDDHDLGLKLSFLSNLGFVHYHLGEFDAALSAYDQGIELARRVSDPLAEANLLSRKSAALAEQDHLPAALQAAKRALALAEEADHLPLVAELQALIAFTYHDLGQTAMALEHCRAALTAYETLDDDDKAGFIREFLHQLRSA